MFELTPYTGEIRGQSLGLDQVPFVGATTRITDHSCGATHQSQRPVTGILKSSHGENTNEVSQMEARRGGIDAVIKRDRSGIKQIRQLGFVGVVLNQPAYGKIFENLCALHGNNDMGACRGSETNCQQTGRRMRRIVIILVVVATVATSCSYQTKDFDQLFAGFTEESLQTAQTSRVWDRNGKLITELRGDQNRTDVSIRDIPEIVQHAVVAIEDERFYDHSGVDFKAILRAARTNVSAGGIAQGGSTITQQYVGNVFLDRSDQTGSRKIEEIFMARRFEQRFSKDFILGKYLNWVYFGSGAWGVEAAAREYFGPPSCEKATNISQPDDRNCLKVSELTLEQAALIAGLIQSPNSFNPNRDYEAALKRRNLVLGRMLANDYITQEEHDEAVAKPIELVKDVPVLEQRYPAAYFVEDVKQWFLDNPAFGPTRQARTRLLFEGGLDIHTTVDLDLQAKAEAAIEAILPDNGTNPDAAAVVIGTTPADDGEVLVQIGGRDFFGDSDTAKFNLASGPGRQAGSAMKPIALATALELGIPITRVYPAPMTIEIDEPSICGPIWKVRGGLRPPKPDPDVPVDPEAPEVIPEATLVRATRSSLNVVYAQLMVDITPKRYVNMAERLGIGEGRLQEFCAVVLGTENVNMMELANVFSTFARGGVRVDPIMVTKITNNDGTVLFENGPKPVRVLNRTVANQLTWALTNVVNFGTGTRAKIDRPAAGKTGTAQNNADAAFAGFTTQRTATIWVGFPEGQIPMKKLYHGGPVQGGTFPAEIWKAIMLAAEDGLPVEDFPTPPPSSTTTTLPPLPDSVEVPNLIGRVVDDALLQELEDTSLLLAQADIETNEFAPGTIVNQAPAPLEFVPGGATVTVEIAVLPPDSVTEIVPNVVGLSEAEAKGVLVGLAFAVNTVYQPDPAASDTAPIPGLVWSIDPPAGQSALTGALITIKVNPTS